MTAKQDDSGVAPARSVLDQCATCDDTGATNLGVGPQPCPICKPATGVPVAPDNRTRPLTDQSQPWTPEHCKAYPRRASEEIEYLRGQLAASGVAPTDEAPQRAATRAEVLSDVDPVVLECWRLQGRKVGAMLREAQAAVIELQEKLDDAAPGVPASLRRLTLDEVCEVAPDTMLSQAQRIQHKFCEANGLPPPGPSGVAPSAPTMPRWPAYVCRDECQDAKAGQPHCSGTCRIALKQPEQP
jgi:hypothetical protein